MMVRAQSDTCMLEKPTELTGLVTAGEQGVTEPDVETKPLSSAWISNDLLRRTVEVWSEAYGRPISEDEAMEILMNIKRMAELLLEMRKEAGQR